MSSPNQAPAMEMEAPGVFERLETAFRNSRIGQLATIGVASWGVASAAEAYSAEPVGAENVPGVTSAPDTSTASSKQECERVAIERPKIKHLPHMADAGVRPFTGFKHSQAVVGAFEYSDMPEDCSPDWSRVAVGRVQMFRHGHWVQIINESIGGWNLSEGGVSRVNVAPTHADPGFDYMFNDCVNGKFHDMRIDLKTRFRNKDSKKIVSEKDYILPIPVQGNCSKAARSKRIAEEQQKTLYG